LYDEADGILIYDLNNEIYFADSKSEPAAQQTVRLLNRQNDTVVHGEILLPYMEAQGYHISAPYQYLVCMETIPYAITENAYTIQKADQASLSFICANYSNTNLATAEYIGSRIQEGMLIVCDHKKAVGFIGTHNSGSIGILEVLEAYRRKGIGELLTKTMLNERIKTGMLAFAEVYPDNEKSLSLANKLHLQRSQGMIYWADTQAS